MAAAHLTPAFGHPSPRCGEGIVSARGSWREETFKATPGRVEGSADAGALRLGRWGGGAFGLVGHLVAFVVEANQGVGELL